MELPCRLNLIKRLSLLGAHVDVITPQFVMDFVSTTVVQHRKAIVANHNMHSLYLFKKNQEMRRFYTQAALIEIDSVPMIIWAKLMGHNVGRRHRCTYLDYREAFWERAEREGWRVYHVGGAPENTELSKTNILSRFPNLKLDVHTGYFDVTGADNDALIADIAQKAPGVLLVGMGMPRQELWILDNFERLPPCVILPVGAALDYEAGVMYTPPRWTGRFGIEWLVRFFHEPSRLFERYFLEPWVLIPQLLGDVRQRVFGKSKTEVVREVVLES